MWQRDGQTEGRMDRQNYDSQDRAIIAATYGKQRHPHAEFCSLRNWKCFLLDQTVYLSHFSNAKYVETLRKNNKEYTHKKKKNNWLQNDMYFPPLFMRTQRNGTVLVKEWCHSNKHFAELVLHHDFKTAGIDWYHCQLCHWLIHC